MVVLNPHLGLHNGLIAMAAYLLIAEADRVCQVANLVKEIALRLAGDYPPENSLHLMHDQLGHGIDAGRAVDIARLGSEVLPRQFNPGVAALKLVEVVPVGGCRLVIQQPRLGQETDPGTHRGEVTVVPVLFLQPGNIGPVFCTAGRGLRHSAGIWIRSLAKPSSIEWVGCSSKPEEVWTGLPSALTRRITSSLCCCLLARAMDSAKRKISAARVLLETSILSQSKSVRLKAIIVQM